MASLPDACATHENPPLINWEPCEEQVRFHIDRLRMMAGSYSLVFDASHWWLNALERVFDECEGSKAIGLVRDTDACVRSFLSVKGRGRGSVNHWALPDNGISGTTFGDPTYPSYEIPPELAGDIDAAKAAQIKRCVRRLNESLVELAKRHPQRILLLPTEELNNDASSERIEAFIAQPLRIPFAALNVGSTLDSSKALFRL